MFSVQMSEKWFCVCVLLTQSWSWWPADGSCFYPGHQSNENVTFFTQPVDHIYPPGTIAYYTCEKSAGEVIKHIECHNNGTWVTRYAKTNYLPCAIMVFYRCQRPRAATLEPLRTQIIEDTCVRLYGQVADTEHFNLTDTCDTDSFITREARRAQNFFYSYSERRLICDSFGFPQKNGGPSEITLTTIHGNSGEAWLNQFHEALKSHGKKTFSLCLTLKCYEWSACQIFDQNTCDISKNYWMCRHKISSCGIPSQLENSIMNFSGIYVGDTARYQCYQGYNTSDTLIRTCLGNGLWYGEAPTCERIVSCGIPWVRINVTRTYSGIHFGDIAEYKCLHGYTTKDTLIRKCEKSSHWVPRNPRCEFVNCGIPEHSENVTIQLINGSTTFGSWLSYTCNATGYHTNGSQYRTCQANGHWDGEEPACLLTENNALVLSQFGFYPGEVDLLVLIVGGVFGATFFFIALVWLVLAAVLYRDKRKQHAQSGETKPEMH